MRTRTVIGVLGALVFAPAAGAAEPAPVFTEFTGGATPGFSAAAGPAGLALAADGNVWAAATQGSGRIVRVTPAGTFTELTGGVTPGFSPGRGPANPVAGPDGNLWVTEFANPGGIAKVTPAGAVTEYAGGVAPNANPAGITVGPDGALWFAEFANPGRISRITTTGAISPVVTGGTTPGFSANSQPRGIALGPDGNVWFTGFAPPGRIGRVTPAGVATEFVAGATPGLPADARPVGIVPGPDGNLWFTDQGGGGRIGRITPAGVVTEFSTFAPDRQPSLLVAGPDGNLWFTEQASPGGIGRITPAGEITEFPAGTTPGFTPGRAPLGITVGGDGNVWFSEAGDPGAIVRISPAPAPPTPPAPPRPPAPPAPPARDTAPPETTITSGPADGDDAVKATYAFSSSEPGSGFQCRTYDASGNPALVTERFVPCTSAVDVPLPTRPQIQAFEVRAIDAAGNVDPTPAARHLIKHGAAGPPAEPSRCRMIAVERSHGHGKRLLPGCRLAKIASGKVTCMQVNTLKTRNCAFDRRKGAYLESTSGPDYAMVGQAVPAKGGKRSDWVVAAARTSGRTVPCRRPPATPRDTAGRVSPGSELAVTCVVEEVKQKWNALSAYGWTPLVNHTPYEVCSANRPGGVLHPDGVKPLRLLPGGAGACYTGNGAALNDLNGTERDARGVYLQGPTSCHYIVVGGLEVPAAKRPDSRYPRRKGADGKTVYDLTRREFDPATTIRWLPVDPNVNLPALPVRDEPEPEPASAPVQAP